MNTGWHDRAWNIVSIDTQINAKRAVLVLGFPQKCVVTVQWCLISVHKHMHLHELWCILHNLRLQQSRFPPSQRVWSCFSLCWSLWSYTLALILLLSVLSPLKLFFFSLSLSTAYRPPGFLKSLVDVREACNLKAVCPSLSKCWPMKNDHLVLLEMRNTYGIGLSPVKLVLYVWMWFEGIREHKHCLRGGMSTAAIVSVRSLI